MTAQGSVYQRRRPDGSVQSWAWSFTTGSRRTRRRTHNGAGYPTQEAAALALANAIAKYNARPTPQRLEPVTAIVDWSRENLVDLVDSEMCTSECLFAGSPTEMCDCRCSGAHHGWMRIGLDGDANELARLRTVALVRDRLTEYEDSLVLRAKARGLTWRVIAAAAGRHPAHLCRKHGLATAVPASS